MGKLWTCHSSTANQVRSCYLLSTFRTDWFSAKMDHWAPGEPSDEHVRHGKHQDCLALKSARDAWTNEFCFQLLLFICEREYLWILDNDQPEKQLLV
ncbi:hypothetical protein ACF0H5_011123 [Mactra antiquata]